MKKTQEFSFFPLLTFFLLAVALIFSSCFTINAGERGVLMRFGAVQTPVLGEGIHFIIPLVNTIEKLSVRVQKQQISAEASSKDLQEVFTDISLNWHIIADEANVIFQEIGDEKQIIERIINPAVEEVLKAIMAKYTAEEIIKKREEVKAGVDELLASRVSPYHISVDDISLVHVHFSQKFSDAVEMKQIAEQEAKRAEFVAQKALRDAEAKVNLAGGEAEAQRLLRENLTSEILQKQAIEKWDGKLPLIVGDNAANRFLDVRQFMPSK
jgi:prohibitin 1